MEDGIRGQSYELEKKKPEVNWCTLGLRLAHSFSIDVPESERSNAGGFGIALSHLGPVPTVAHVYQLQF